MARINREKSKKLKPEADYAYGDDCEETEYIGSRYASQWMSTGTTSNTNLSFQMDGARPSWRKEKIRDLVFVVIAVIIIVTCFATVGSVLHAVRSATSSEDGIQAGMNPSTVDSEENDPVMVLMQVTERRLSVDEIDAAGNINIIATSRSVPDFEEASDELTTKGGAKRRSLNSDDDTDALFASTCDPSVYYEAVQSFLSRDELQKLLETTHRKRLPYTNKDSDDVWKALKDLDRGDDDSTVRLIYSSKDIPAEPKGTADTWNREHVWPKSRGVGKSGHDFTDVHHLFPADWGINSIRSNRFFDICTEQSACKIPAELKESEEPPEYIGDIFQPPSEVRGDVARAILYMDLRYPHLELTDCLDPEKENQMAYLSTLLDWHELDPPTEAERKRNDRACSRWQGNRNPFVDFPALASVLHDFNLSNVTTQTRLGLESLVLGTRGNDRSKLDEAGLRVIRSDRRKRCNAPSPAPDDEFPTPDDELPSPDDESPTPDDELPTPDDQSPTPDDELPAPGDVVIAGVHSDNPDIVALAALVDLPAGLVIHITDNAYDGNAFASNEGTISLTLPKAIPAGTIFGYGEGLLYGSSWISKTDKGFALSSSGDTIIVYYTTSEEPEDGDITFLSGASFAGGRFTESTGEFGTAMSALPKSIADFAIDLGTDDNYIYTGKLSVTKASLQEYLLDTENWKGSNTKESVSVSLLEPFIV